MSFEFQQKIRKPHYKMKKPYDNLWPSVTEFTNLELAFRKAARGKRKRQSNEFGESWHKLLVCAF